MMLLSISMYAQGTVVSGRITDKDGKPLPDAVVMLSGSTTVAAMSDVNGYYKITVPDAIKSKLSVSMISFKTIEESVAGRTRINFVLEDDTEFRARSFSLDAALNLCQRFPRLACFVVWNE